MNYYLIFVFLATAGCTNNNDFKNVVVNCGDEEIWSKKALDYYSNSDFEAALNITSASHNCAWVDRQLIFNSYMGLYLQKPSQITKKNALEEYSRFNETPDLLADPGPMLITIGEDDQALAWYKGALIREKAKMNAQNYIDSSSMNRVSYYQFSISIISSSDWSDIPLNERLKKLLLWENLKSGE